MYRDIYIYIVNIRDGGEYMKVFLYFYHTSVSDWGVKPTYIPKPQISHSRTQASGGKRAQREALAPDGHLVVVLDTLLHERFRMLRV